MRAPALVLGFLALICAFAKADDADRNLAHGADVAGYDALSLAAPLRSDEGTLSFWVQPSWSHDDASHTLVSMRWMGEQSSYFVISEGWWEPRYANYLHLIVSNEDEFGCSAPYKLAPGVWTKLTAVWRAGDHGMCRLYVDDRLIASRDNAFKGGRIGANEIAVGSDRAAQVTPSRPAPASFKDWFASSSSWSSAQVIKSYVDGEAQSPAQIAAKKWHWLQTARRLQQLPHSHGNRNQETRALFEESFEWALNARAIDERIALLKAAGFNVYVPCVWHGRGTRYRSASRAMEKALAERVATHWDPLSYLIDAAHRADIQVYAWFTVALRDDTSLHEYAGPGVPEGAFDVHDAGFREYIVDTVLDVARHYSVDGINLDYIRAIGVCTSRDCRRSYADMTGGDLLRDRKSASRDRAARDKIQAWQDRDVGRIVTAVADNVRSVAPHMVISVDSVVETDAGARPLEGRDEVRWANAGLIDAVFHMDYARHLDSERIASARARLKDPTKLVVLIANYDSIDGRITSREPEWIDKAASLVRNDWGQGVAVYNLPHLSLAQARQLRVGAFAVPLSGGARP